MQLDLNDSGSATGDEGWAAVPLNGKPTEGPSTVPVGLRGGYKEQGSWLRYHAVMVSSPSCVVAAQVKNYRKHIATNPGES